jgi:hypothetical protein
MLITAVIATGKNGYASDKERLGVEMAAKVYNPNIVKLVAAGDCEGQVILNVTHWERSVGDPWSVASMGALASEYVSWWGLNAQGLTRADYVMRSVTVTQMALDGLQTISTVDLPLSGSLVGDALPLNVAACVTLSGDRSGKAGRGRYYLGCLGESQTVGSRFTPAFVLACNQAFESFPILDDLTGPGTFNLVVYSTEFNKLPRTVGLATRVTSAFLRDNIVDSQRRRLPGRGR